MQLNRLEYNGKLIQQRESDGYVNLTQMIKAGGNNKRLNDFFSNKETKAYIAQLSIDTGIPASELFSIKKGGNATLQGTWGHPLLALDLGRWISPEFAIWCDAHIFVLMTTGKTSLDIDPIEMTMQLIAENYQEIDQINEIDDRFIDGIPYAHCSKDMLL